MTTMAKMRMTMTMLTNDAHAAERRSVRALAAPASCEPQLRRSHETSDLSDLIEGAVSLDLDSWERARAARGLPPLIVE